MEKKVIEIEPRNKKGNIFQKKQHELKRFIKPFTILMIAFKLVR